MLVKGALNFAILTVVMLIISVPPMLCAQELADPTRPDPKVLSSSQDGMLIDTPLSALTIEAIIQRGTVKRVIINGETLKTGDIYRGFTVLAIEKNSVLLANDSEQRKFLVNNNDVAKNVSTEL